MKHNDVNVKHIAFQYAIALWLVILTANLTLAQQRALVDPGILRIKVSEQLAQRLETSRMARNADNVLLTGVQSLDRANIKYKVNTIQRVFRDAGKFEAKHRRYGLHLWYEIRMDKSSPVFEALADFQAIEHIQQVEPSYKKSIIGSNKPGFGPIRVSEKELTQAPLTGIANDPMLGNQWHYHNTGQGGGTPGADISLFQAWSIETGTPNVIVAVTDGGAQVNHPDLAANMWVNVDEVPGNNLDDDNNGFVDDINGYGFGDNTGTIAPDDHGSHTSGTIAAVTNNGIGVSGVAGGSGAGDGARIMTLAAFGGVGTGGFEETYVYGADNGAVISQNSWGYDGENVVEQSVLDGIDYFIAEAGKDENGNQVGPMRGGIVIFSAGNDDADGKFYPAYYEKTLAVGARNNQDKKAWYSNYGTWVDISAPGGETFISNDPKGVLSTISGNQYAYFQGTSMACPHVSGVAALLVSKFGGNGFTPEMLRGRLTQLSDNVESVDPEFAGLLGSGRLNAFKALQEDDGDAPDAITDLAASQVNITSVTLTWTSPTDPGNGSASVYDIRYATFPITNSNFSTATAVLNPPVPLPAGVQQSFTVSGLQPGTVYYFAIKSADFFGNYSEISNVLEQATNFPPVVSVEPDSLTADLQTAEVETRTLTISNTGAGVLNFQFDSLTTSDFARPVPVSGSVPPGGTLDVAVTIDANNRLPGTYHQDLTLRSNDPATPRIKIPVTLNVSSNGQPIASVAPSALDFGQVFETGTATKTLTIHNAGAESLHILSVTSSNSEFTTDFSDSTASVPPFQSVLIHVTYSPAGLGASSGNLLISTNDPDHASITIPLQGEGVPAPDVEVSPASLSASLNTGRTATQNLTIRNNGGSDLVFSADVTTPGASAKIATVKSITIPVTHREHPASIQRKAKGSGTFSNVLKLKSVSQASAIANVLILSPDDDVTDIEAVLDAFDDVEADIFPKASLPSITLADLESYDVVFTTNNTKWLASGGVEPEVIGDLLADYVDAGGKVISNQFNYSYDDWKLEGRFIDEHYGPFLSATSDEDTTVELGNILAPGHPVMAGVSDLMYQGFVQNVGLAPGATALAQWDNGELFIAVNENVVALNLLPSLGGGEAPPFAGDLPLIYQNAIHFLSGPGFIELNPSEGTVPAGSQLDIAVTFDATGLDSGLYQASINIATNVPGKELVIVPAELTVLGPEFTASPSALHEELEKNQTSTRTIVLRNNGPDDQTFTVDVQGAGASASIVRLSPVRRSMPMAVSRPAEKIQSNTAQRTGAAYDDKTSLSLERPVVKTALRSILPTKTSATQYGTDFEDFDLGDVDGQQDWFGQFGNWTIESENPFSGNQHFRGLADGLGLSAAVTPLVPIGTDEKSSASMKLNIKGTGVTWQIIPESPSAGLVNTRIQFGPDGKMSALVQDGSSTAFQSFGSTPAGYFDLTIEVDRDSSYFHVYIDGARVFTGQGFNGDVEEVAVLSAMEKAGPTLDLDDIKIIDGKKESGVSFVKVSPLAGHLPAGASVELTVTFNSNDLEFGTYNANINIKAGQSKLTVPASLRVFGDPNIDVDPTFLQATVDYKESTTKTLAITNTGGNPLNYSLQVIGAATNQATIKASTKKPVARVSGPKTQEKIARDERNSRPVKQSISAIQLLTGAALLQEDFEDASFPPAGWQVVDNEGTGLVWNFASFYGEGNYAGTGEAATASSDAAGVVEFDTELITPSVSTAGYKNIAVQYNVNYQNLAGLDFLDLDIQVDGGAWQTVQRWNEDHGALRGAGVFVTVPLGSYIGNGAAFRLRWHYYDPNTDDFDWYAQIDDVTIIGDPRAWLTVSPSAGTVPVGETVDIEAKFSAADIEAGSYVAGIIVSSNAVEDPVVGVVAQLTVRKPAIMSVTPKSLYQELLTGQKASQTLTISNTGPSTLKYAFGNTPKPAAVSLSGQARKEPVNIRMAPSSEREDYLDVHAMRPKLSQKSSTPLYVSGFEEFAPGDIDGQNGWSGQFGNWAIEAENPYEGMQHIRSASDGFGATRAFSPTVAIGTDPISSASLRISAATGVTWQVIPQSPTAGFVNTRLQIGADGKLSVLAKDSLGNSGYVPVETTLPDGYFELRIDVVRATSIFTVFVDGMEVFSGTGFAGNIEEIVLFSAMEVSGPIMDIDNLAIYDGPAVAPWLNYTPKSGIVPPGGSATVTVEFNATDLDGGTYTDVLKLSSNDPKNALVEIPVTLKVLVNTPPVLEEPLPVQVIELGSIDVTFKATDIDHEPVTVVLTEDLNFVTLLNTADGSATYRIAPAIGDRGTYDLQLTATDARGKQDTKTFHLSVIPYGVESFTLFNNKTNTPVETFDDTVKIDINQRDLSRLVIRANTNPATVGSVKFFIDGYLINVDNAAPYALNETALAALTLLFGGDHQLVAKSFTGRNGTGTEGKSLSAVIEIVNSALVTDFDVVDANGKKITDLVNGAVIDIKKQAYKHINIKANASGGKVKSMIFRLNGEEYRIDNLAPYQLAGLGTLVDLPWQAKPGTYTVTATPYSEIYGLGIAGQSLTVSFTVVNGAKPAARMIAGEDESEEESDAALNIYPVPVRDELHVQLRQGTEGQARLIIQNAQGQTVFSDEGSVGKFRNYDIGVSKLSLSPGVYFIQIQRQSGKVEVKKFIKE